MILLLYKRLHIDKEIVREVLGYKDEYDFIDNINE